MTARKRIRRIRERCVMIPPPTRSAIGPAPVRASDPTRGPRNAYVRGSGAPGKLPYSVLMRSGNAAEKPENEPKVITYVIVQNHVCLLWKISSCSLNEASTGTLRSENHARIPKRSSNGTYHSAAFCSQTWEDAPPLISVCDVPIAAKPMIQGDANCARLTPKLPTPAWMPSAVPCNRLGKNTLVLGMCEEKSPPPNPASNPSTRKTQKGVSVVMTATPIPTHGISLRSVEMLMTCRVPKIGMRNA